METQPPNEASQRVRELEARVEQLSQEVQSLRAERQAYVQRGRRAGDPKPPQPPIRRRIWLARALLLLMTSVLCTAVYTVLRGKLASFDPDADVWRQLAGMPIDYPLLALVAAGGLSILAYLSRRMLTFMALALTCCYVAYAVYLAGASTSFPIATRTYGVLLMLYLVTCYALASWLGIYESLRLGRGRRRAAFLALANAFAFYPLLWMDVRAQAPDSAWIVYVGLAVVNAFFALLAESIGSHRNYMFQLFSASAILLVNAALHHVLSEERLLIALAIECLVLAAVYHASGVVLLKVLNLFALVATVILALRSTKLGTPVPVAGVTLRANWIYGLSTCALLVLAAIYYERHIRSLQPQHRRLSGHWFLADTFWDVNCVTVGLLHAAAGALIVMVLTIADFGDRPSLPYLMAAASVSFAVLGFIVRAPELEVSAVMLIVATHVSYYFFLYIGKERFSDQPHFAGMTLLVIGYTFFGAHRWDRYLRGLQRGHPWEHYFSASIPYLVGTAMSLTLMERQIPQPYLPVAQGALGLGLVIAGAFMADAAVKTAGVAAVLAGTVLYLNRLSVSTPEGADAEHVWALMTGMLVLIAATERILLLGRRIERGQARVERFTRSLLVLAVAATGLLALRAGAAPDALPLLWVGHACVCVVLGTMFGENRYRWAAMGVLMATLIWTFIYEQAPLADGRSVRLLAGTVVASLLLTASWGIAVRRRRSAGPLPPFQPKGPSPDG